MNPSFVVEGPADSRFLTDYIAEVFGQGLDEKVDFIKVGTDWRGLDGQIKNLERARDNDRSLLVVLDADEDTPHYDKGGFAKRNAAVLGWLQNNNFAAPVFLWPNHKDDGDLETILEKAALPTHGVIFRCFEQYETCLHTSNQLYVTPNRKAKIYAYLEALGVRGDERDRKRNYRNSLHWDLKAAGLQPLKDFLAPHFGGG
jgi:hypothetical protein